MPYTPEDLLDLLFPGTAARALEHKISRVIPYPGGNLNDHQSERIRLEMFHLRRQDKPAELVKDVIGQCMCEQAVLIHSK